MKKEKQIQFMNRKNLLYEKEKKKNYFTGLNLM